MRATSVRLAKRGAQHLQRFGGSFALLGLADCGVSTPMSSCTRLASSELVRSQSRMQKIEERGPVEGKIPAQCLQQHTCE